MNLLLDTHVILWWLMDDSKLSPLAKDLISDVNSLIFISAASVWEISIKKNLGKLEVPDDIDKVFLSNEFEDLPITLKHAQVAGSLPKHHIDPFDRMLIAQAQCENIRLLTSDKKLLDYGNFVIKT